MKVFHGPINTGGMAGVCAKAQRALGIEAISYCYPNIPYNFYSDHYISYDELNENPKSVFDFYIKVAKDFDVFQFYYGTSLAGVQLFDIQYLKKLKKKVFFYFCGCDIRDSKTTIQKYKSSACKNCWPVRCSTNHQHAIAIANQYADGIFVSTPDLLEFVPKARWLPQPIELDRFTELRNRITVKRYAKKQEKIRIVHIPTNRKIKGTSYIEAAIKTLQEKNYPVELILIENKPYAEVLQICSQADLLIDQVLIGAYGQVSVEMMALGKPVICYLRDDLVSLYPKVLPIINADQDTLLEVLMNVLKEPSTLDRVSELGVNYVTSHHDSLAVAKIMQQHYSKQDELCEL